MSEPLWMPRPAAVGDLPGARQAAASAFRRAYPDIPPARVRIAYVGAQLVAYDGGQRAAPTPVPVQHAAPGEDAVVEQEVPPPSLPATECTGEEPWLGRGPRSWVALAKKHRWRWRVTRAVGPRIGASGAVLEHEARTLCIAMQGPDRERLVVEYRWNGKRQAWEVVDIVDGVNGVILPAAWAKERIRDAPGPPTGRS